MATQNHRVEGQGIYLGMLLAGVMRHAWAFVWRGGSGSTSTFEGWMGGLQWGLGAVVVGGLGYVAWEVPTLQWASGGLAVVGLVGLVAALALAAAVDHVRPPPIHLEAGRPDLDPPATPSAAELVLLHPGLGVAAAPLQFYGAPFGTRMSVVDTGEGWLVYSPIPWTESLHRAVQSLGEVRWIVAPNPLHHLFLRDWAEAFPEAEVWLAPGLKERRPEWEGARVLEPGLEPPWPQDLVETEVVQGHPSHVEVVMFHRPSQTLVVSDLIENLGHEPGPWTRSQRRVLRWFMMDRRPGPPTDWKLTVDQPELLKASVDRILGWEPRAIVMAHGPPIFERATGVVSDGFAFLR